MSSAENLNDKVNIVETNNLTKQWGNIIAVNHVNFEIKEGEIFGFLGPNGAGKTTTIKLLNTLLTPTDGTATVGGYDIIKNPSEVRRN